MKNESALPAVRNRKSFRERYNKNVVYDRTTDTNVRSNHYLYTECTSMHVMADLSRKDEPTTVGTDSETPLCRVTYDKARKLLTINPDFTITGEQHYNVTNSYGVKFNYRIEHVSEGRTPLELQEHREDARRVSMQLFVTRTIGIPNFRVTVCAPIKRRPFRGKTNLGIPERRPFICPATQLH